MHQLSDAYVIMIVQIRYILFQVSGDTTKKISYAAAKAIDY